MKFRCIKYNVFVYRDFPRLISVMVQKLKQRLKILSIIES